MQERNAPAHQRINHDPTYTRVPRGRGRGPTAAYIDTPRAGRCCEGQHEYCDIYCWKVETCERRQYVEESLHNNVQSCRYCRYMYKWAVQVGLQVTMQYVTSRSRWMERRVFQRYRQVSDLRLPF
jgi:hypothetical protein